MPPAALFAGLGPIAASILSSVISLVLSIGLGMIQKMMTKKPKQSGPANSELKITVKQPNAPWRVIYGVTRVGGIYSFIHTVSNNGRLLLNIMLAGHEVEEIGEIWFDDEIVPLDGSGGGSGGGGGATGKYAGLVAVHKWLGTPTQNADPQLIVEAGDKWTANHRLRGRAHITVFLNYSQDKFPNGVPNITAVVKGKKVYDPALDATYWTDNAALCIADYLHDASYGLGAAYGTEIDNDALAAAANICEEAVPLVAGGTENRYTINGTFETDSKPVDILGDMLNAMSGRAIHAGGRWRILAGAWQVPVTTLDENDLRGAFKVQTLLSRRENFNAVKGQYISAGNKYQETDFPAVVSATYQAQDGGERIYKDIKLPFTNSPGRAQRLAKIELLRARQPITVPDVPFQLGAYRVQCGDVIGFSNDRMGWAAKSFEVTQATLVVDRSSDEAPLIGVNLSLRETDASIFDWETDEESTVDSAPNTNMPDIFNVGAPGSLLLESGDEMLLLLGEGSVLSQIRVSWTAPLDAFVQGYEIQWKKSTETEWMSPMFTGNTATQWLIVPVEDGVSYDVRVRSKNIAEVRSGWVQQDGHVVIGKTAPPPTPNTFTVSRLADGTRRFAWVQFFVPADVRAGGGYRIRWFSGTTSDWTAMTPLHNGLLVNSPHETNELAAGTYTFAIKTVDSSGNESTDALFINGALLGDPRLVGVLFTQREEDLFWPGALTDCYVDFDNVIRANSVGGWAALASTWAALSATWASLGTSASPITYETLEIDLGADLTFTPILSVVALGTATIEMKVGDTADGSVVGAYGVVGLQTSMRYVQFKVEVTGATPEISSFSIMLDGQTKVEEFNDVDTATSTATWFDGVAAGHFKIGSRGGLATITQARLALQSVGPGWTWEVISKSATVGGEVAAEFKVYNNSDVLADALVDVELRGSAG